MMAEEEGAPPLPPVIAGKFARLQALLHAMGNVAVAFSGGVDSTLLAQVAYNTLGCRARAIHLDTPLHTDGEHAEAQRLASRMGIALTVLPYNPLDSTGFAANPPERCYLCKKALYSHVLDVLRLDSAGTVLADGTNCDDLGEHRPGLAAVSELGVRMPFVEAGFTKAEIRELARCLGLANWAAPSASCLATRIPSGTNIIAADLRRVAILEGYLGNHLGFHGHRVRLDGEQAVLECEEAGFERLLSKGQRNAVLSFFGEHGVRQVFLNLISRKSVITAKLAEIACSA